MGLYKSFVFTLWLPEQNPFPQLLHSDQPVQPPVQKKNFESLKIQSYLSDQIIFHERKIFPAKNLFRKLRKLTTNLEKSVVTKFAAREYFPREVLNKVVLLRGEIDLNTSVRNGVE